MCNLITSWLSYAETRADGCWLGPVRSRGKGDLTINVLITILDGALEEEAEEVDVGTGTLNVLSVKLHQKKKHNFYILRIRGSLLVG